MSARFQNQDLCRQGYESWRVMVKIVFDFSNGTWIYTIYSNVKRHTHQPHDLPAYLFIGKP